MPELTNEQLLALISEEIQNMPALEDFRLMNVTADQWAGRTKALVRRWDDFKAIPTVGSINSLLSPATPWQMRVGDYRQIRSALHEIQLDLQMKTAGPLAISIPAANPFDYFDEIRKIVLAAKTDLFVVDPYLGPDFVSKFLTQLGPGVPIRLLGRKYMDALVPAVQALVAQNGLSVQIRHSPDFHDRFVFVDQVACYQSGASFQDGAIRTPTTLTQITDAVDQVLNIYETLWLKATAKL